MKIKSKIYIASIFLCIGIGFTNCAKDKIPAPDLTNVSFSKDVQPIFSSNCSTSSCHDGSIAPDLRDGKAYNSLIGGAFVIDSTNLSSNTLYNEVAVKKSMPPSGPLQQSQIDIITTWIKNGYKDN